MYKPEARPLVASLLSTTVSNVRSNLPLMLYTFVAPVAAASIWLMPVVVNVPR